MESIHYYQVAVPTAFDLDEQLNLIATRQHVEYLATQGIRSVLICGSTGEQHSLSLEEKLALVDSLNELHVPENFEIVFGVASIRQREAEILAAHISHSKQIKAIMIGFPPYILPSQSDAILYVQTIMEKANKPTILYNNPLRTGFDLSLDAYQQLLTNEQIIGIKEAGDPHKVSQLKKRVTRELLYFIGGEKALVEKIDLGFNALSTISGNLYPTEIKTWFDTLLDAQEVIDVDPLAKEIAEIFAISALPYLKQAISKKEGIEFGICRAPLGRSFNE